MGQAQGTIHVSLAPKQPEDEMQFPTRGEDPLAQG